jgi:hypothetical protein
LNRVFRCDALCPLRARRILFGQTGFQFCEMVFEKYNWDESFDGNCNMSEDEHVAIWYTDLSDEDPFAGEGFVRDDGMSSRKLKVFLCYSHKDFAQVYSLFRKLSSSGFDTWLDKVSLLPGQDWELEITKAVRSADIFIACLTQEFVSKSGFSQKEIRLAWDVAQEQPEGTIFIIPLRLEECEIPDRLKRWHWCNLFEQTGYEQLIKSDLPPIEWTVS